MHFLHECVTESGVVLYPNKSGFWGRFTFTKRFGFPWQQLSSVQLVLPNKVMLMLATAAVAVETSKCKSLL